MNESLFAKYVAKFFPVLQSIINLVNGKRESNLSYKHKDTAILRRVYSPDNKWEADSVDTSYVAADYVAVDSPLPLKSRGSLEVANGKLPKVGMKKNLKESDINKLNYMEAQGGNAKEISRNLVNDAVACSVGIDERNEYAFLYGLSHGYVAVKDEDKPGALLRLKFGYLDKNTYGIASASGLTVDDLKDVIDQADADGNTITKFWISKTKFNALKKTAGAKEMVATYRGQTFDSSTILPTPTTSAFEEAFEDETGVTFEIVDRSVMIEIDGVKTSKKPWDNDKVIGVCSTQLGALVYGRLAEQTNPVAGVTYQTIDIYKLISKFSKTDPLIETTASQAYVLPVIENPDQIYIIDTTDVQSVDTDAESDDTGDIYTTVWGSKYVKSELVTAFNALGTGVTLKNNSSDADIIKAINTLSVRKENALKASLTPVDESDE